MWIWCRLIAVRFVKRNEWAQPNDMTNDQFHQTLRISHQSLRVSIEKENNAKAGTKLANILRRNIRSYWTCFRFVFTMWHLCSCFDCYCCCAFISHNFANWNENKIKATNRTLIISTWIRHIFSLFHWMQCTIKWIWLFDTVHEARQMPIFAYPFIFFAHIPLTEQLRWIH